MTRESDYFREYENILNEMDKYHDVFTREEDIHNDMQMRKDEVKEFERLYR